MNLSLKKEEMKAVTDMPFNIGTSVDAQVLTEYNHFDRFTDSALFIFSSVFIECHFIECQCESFFFHDTVCCFSSQNAVGCFLLMSLCLLFH